MTVDSEKPLHALINLAVPQWGVKPLAEGPDRRSGRRATGDAKPIAASRHSRLHVREHGLWRTRVTLLRDRKCIVRRASEQRALDRQRRTRSTLAQLRTTLAVVGTIIVRPRL